MQRKNPSIVQYVSLALLFVLAAGYQLRSAMFEFPTYFHFHVVGYPFTPDYDKERPTIRFVGRSAKQAGLENGDVLLSVNGRSLTGLAVYGETIREAKPGDTLTVQVLRAGETETRAVELRQATSRPLNLAGLSILLLKVVVPTFALLIGFWVAAVRPRDPSAWCLCLIMLFFSTYYSARTESWGPVVRDVAEAYRVAVATLWPVFMLLFVCTSPSHSQKRTQNGGNGPSD